LGGSSRERSVDVDHPTQGEAVTQREKSFGSSDAPFGTGLSQRITQPVRRAAGRHDVDSAPEDLPLIAA
jgi:hypothetical protein